MAKETKEAKMKEQPATLPNLIKAFQIFLKYFGEQDTYPTHCSHDMLSVGVDPMVVSNEDKLALEELGFTPGEFNDFTSYRYGSA